MSSSMSSSSSSNKSLALKFLPEDLLKNDDVQMDGKDGEADEIIGNKNTDEMRFTLSDINVSLANGIRRIILSEIPIVVFADPGIAITVNTTRLNNELLKQRLRCIPIYTLTTADTLTDYEVRVDVQNVSNETVYVTTEHFQVFDKRTKKPILGRRLFPPSVYFGEECFPVLARLRRQMVDKVPEQLTFTCQFSVGTAQVDSAYNVASKATFGSPVDDDLAEAHWRDVKLPELLLKNPELNVAFAKKDFDLLDRGRFTQPDKFDFIIQSVGPFTPKTIMYKALAILVDKLAAFKSHIAGEGIILPSKSTMAQAYDITLNHGEGYTLGLILEFELHAGLYQGTEELSYVGFRKPHPHIDECLIRLAFKDPNTTRSYVQTCLTKAADTAISKFTDLLGEFVE